MKVIFCRFLAVLGCEYAFISGSEDLRAVFRNCVVQYAKNSTCTRGTKVLWAEAQCELLVHAYTWLLYHFDQGEEHRIHRSLIVHSFFWLAFAKSFNDRNRTGHIPFNPIKWRDNINSGQTAMLVLCSRNVTLFTVNSSPEWSQLQLDLFLSLFGLISSFALSALYAD